MKPLLKLTLVLLLVQLQFMSCKKDDCGSCIVPPDKTKTTLRAKAGFDQVITLPTNSALLDGSQSTPTDGKITYSWSKIAGPAFFHIMDAASAKTQVSNLVKGYYEFELTVTDEGGISSKDTVHVSVTGSPGNSLHWTLLGNLPDGEFFFDSNNYNTLFNGSNFLMGIDYQLFAVSHKGGVWQFTGAWNKIGTFPGLMGTVPVVFSINNKGYCMGESHLWQYEPQGNLWQRKKDVPEYIKDVQVALVIGDKVYLVGIETNHIMMYNPLTDTYSPKNNFPGTEPTTGFVVNEAGFCIGADGTCWKYEPATDSWQQKASLPPAVANLKGFSLKEDGYVIGDMNLAAYNTNESMKVWRYETKADTWHEFEEEYPGYGVYNINAVSMDDHVFVGLGYNNGDWNSIDLWRFK